MTRVIKQKQPVIDKKDALLAESVDADEVLSD
jgi:hypothetical protein